MKIDRKETSFPLSVPLSRSREKMFRDKVPRVKLSARCDFESCVGDKGVDLGSVGNRKPRLVVSRVRRASSSTESAIVSTIVVGGHCAANVMALSGKPGEVIERREKKKERKERKR